ncbi:hypothetical protein CVIRNUC_006742 [Coccomyxa viridis]|uniref:TPX2 C-terminal domain-containing protein n=1 Tax=Coccomyxa viridis TaxID=1274662 RepID=A0AAV1I859_9CHLO|nr:hypothetical protein CVIRNUC_006742 [Coccomyxa viridis]
METCTDSDQAGNQLHGASPYVDSDYEFNAPRFYDFQRLKDHLGSPASEGDTYFDTSKVKELRTPVRSSGDEENEDTAQLLKDIQKVREDLAQSEGEATSQRHSVSGLAGSASPLPGHLGKAKQAASAAVAAERAPLQPVTETNEEAAAAAGASKSLAAVDLDTAQPASEPDATAPRGAFLEHAAIAAGPPAAATAAAPAQKPADMRQPALRVQASASNAGPRQDQAAGSAKASVETACAQCSGAGAQELASIPSTACQTGQGGPAPAAAQAPSDAMTRREEERAASTPPPVPKRAAPANLVTSWAQNASAASGLLTSNTTSLVHSAGISHRTAEPTEVCRDDARKAENTAVAAGRRLEPAGRAGGVGDRTTHDKASVSDGCSKASKRSAALAQPAGALDAGPKQPTKRARGATATSAAAKPDGRKAELPAARQSKAIAAQHAEPRTAAAKQGAQPAAQKRPAAKPRAAQKSLTVPRSPALGRARKQQEKQPPGPAQPDGKMGSAPSRKRALTGTKTPELATAQRRRMASNADVSTAPDQEEWKPLALMVAEFEASTPARFNHGPRAVQYVPPAQPDSNARAGAPDFAMDGRLRPSRFKPKEEQELEDMRSRPAFHALPLNQAVMSSQGHLGVRPVPARPVTRSQTPKLATKTRAAAHPAPAQGPVPAPKLRAPFHPGKLTVPQSPAFATRSRLRAQGLVPTEAAEKAFAFTAQPAPDLGASHLAARPQKRRRRQSSFPAQPFQLSTEARGRAKRSAGPGGAPDKAPAFHAAPVPKTLYQPSKLPLIPEARPTQQEAFQLQSEARHQQAVAELEARQAAERQRARRRSQFRAAPPPRFPQPPAPTRSERPATRAVTPRLAVKTRSAARAAFDAAAAENRRMEEEKKAREAAERAEQEAQELKEYRSQLTFKARPMPEHFGGVHRLPAMPEPRMTLALSPQLQTRSRARLPH